jgi:hypothetical protein
MKGTRNQLLKLLTPLLLDEVQSSKVDATTL